MPPWVRSGFEDYAGRLPRRCPLELVEVPLTPRGRRPLAQCLAREGARMVAAIPPRAAVIALDERGQPWTTRELADRLAAWLGAGSDLALLVGGPDGLAPAALAATRERWSLSPLTLPHGLVRVLVAEALYRAWSVLDRHPYHRE